MPLGFPFPKDRRPKTDYEANLGIIDFIVGVESGPFILHYFFEAEEYWLYGIMIGIVIGGAALCPIGMIIGDYLDERAENK